MCHPHWASCWAAADTEARWLGEAEARWPPPDWVPLRLPPAPGWEAARLRRRSAASVASMRCRGADEVGRAGVREGLTRHRARPTPNPVLGRGAIQQCTVPLMPGSHSYPAAAPAHLVLGKVAVQRGARHVPAGLHLLQAKAGASGKAGAACQAVQCLRMWGRAAPACVMAVCCNLQAQASAQLCTTNKHRPAAAGPPPLLHAVVPARTGWTAQHAQTPAAQSAACRATHLQPLVDGQVGGHDGARLLRPPRLAAGRHVGHELGRAGRRDKQRRWGSSRVGWGAGAVSTLLTCRSQLEGREVRKAKQHGVASKVSSQVAAAVRRRPPAHPPGRAAAGSARARAA